MTVLSPETRRLIDLARGADDPSPSREQAVRDRLMGRLGVTALAGAAAASTAAAAAEAAGATGTGLLSSTAATSAAVGSTSVGAGTGVTASALAKTVVGMALVTGLGGAVGHDPIAVRVDDEPAAVAVDEQQAAALAWEPPPHDVQGEGTAPARASEEEPFDWSFGPDERRHQLLVAIARRPDRPVAREAELVLILSAEQQLAAGQLHRARGYLAGHERRYADGALRDRREALRVLADCAEGATARARDGAARFLRVFPGSDQKARLYESRCAPPNADVERAAAPAPGSLQGSRVSDSSASAPGDTNL